MKKVLVLVSGLVALLLIATIGFVLTLDPNEHKDWIEDRFQKSTGLELTLGGELGLTLYPWLGVTANDVTVANPPGFSTDPLLQVSHLQFRARLLPLLKGSYEIDTMRLHGTRVRLEVLGDGRSNWSALADEADDAVEDSSGNSTAILNRIVIGGVDIQDLGLVYDDQFANSRYEIANLNMSIGELVYGEPLDIRLNLDFASAAPRLDADLAMTGTVLYDVDAGRYDLDPLQVQATLRGANVPGGSTDITLTTALHSDLRADTVTLRNLTLDALGTRLEAALDIARVQTDTPALRGSLTLTGDDLPLLFRIIEQEELAQRVASLDREFDVRANLDLDMRSGTLSVPTLEASLLGADIAGNLNGTRVNTDTPAFSGNLNASGPDLPTLIEVAGMFQGGSSGALTQYGRELARVPDKSFRVRSGFDANLQNGTLAVPELYVSLLGATITGDLNASRIHTDTPQISGQLNAQGPDLPLLLQIAGQLQGGREAALNRIGEQLRTGVRSRAFTVSTAFDADLQRGNIRIPTLDAALLGFRLSGQLTASDMTGNDGTLDGRLNLQGENLGEVLTALDQADLAAVAQSLQLDLQASGNRRNLRLSPFTFSLVLAGQQIPNSPQTLALNADTVLNLADDSLRIERFSLAGLGLDLNGTLAASDLNTNPAFSGRLDIPAFNARRLLEQLNQPAPDTADASVLQNVALSTAFRGGSNSLELSDLAVTLDDSRLNGTVAVRDFSTSATRFDLNLDRIDADRYLAPPAESSAGGDDSTEPLPVDTLRALDVQGTLNIGELRISGLAMTDIQVAVNARDGNLALNPVQASLYGGRFEGDLRLDASGDVPAASVATSLDAINLGPLLQDFMDATYLTGNGNIELALSGRGADTPAIKRSLAGSGSLALTDGVLTGVDVGAVLQRIETMIRSRRLEQLPQGGETPFDNFSATLAIDQGAVRSEDLLIRAPGWQVVGAGTLVDLGSDTIDFNLVTSVDATTATRGEEEYNLGGYTLPIACSGNIDSPRCLPDAQQIISAAVTGAVQQRLGDFLQERLGGGQQQQQPAQDGQNLQEAPDDAPSDQEAPAREQPQPAEELLNRALDRLLR